MLNELFFCIIKILIIIFVLHVRLFPFLPTKICHFESLGEQKNRKQNQKTAFVLFLFCSFSFLLSFSIFVVFCFCGVYCVELSFSLSISCRFDIDEMRSKISPDSFFLITPMTKMNSKKLRTKITLLVNMISLTIKATFILMGHRKISSLFYFCSCEFKNSLQFPPPLFLILTSLLFLSLLFT